MSDAIKTPIQSGQAKADLETLVEKLEVPTDLSGHSLVHWVAASCIMIAGQDAAVAVDLMERIAWKKRAIRDAIIEPFVRTACRDAVSHVYGEGRRATSKVPSGATTSCASRRVVERAFGNLSGLMAFSLPESKKPLAKATREEVASAAEYYGKVGKTYIARAHWLRLVAQAVPDSQTVGAALSEERLRELQQEANKIGTE